MHLPPEIQIGVQGRLREFPNYGLSGWDEFDRWMLLNDPLYAATSAHARQIGMNVEDRLKYLVSTMSHRARMSDAHRVELIEKYGLPVMPPA